MRSAMGIAAVGAVLVAGCDTNFVGGDPLVPDDAGFIDSGFEETYPEGPYGVQNGDIIENLVFTGFFAQTSTTGLDPDLNPNIDFQQVRRDGRYRYMLINVAAEWCSGCRIEAELLPDKFVDWGKRGGYVFSVLTEDRVSRPATEPNLRRWVSTFPINYTMVYDPRANINGKFAPPGLPLNVIVDLDTMQIVNQKVGEDLTFLDIFESLLE